jgi:regulator of replication initiation timing
MDWRRVIIEWGWLGMAIPLFGLVGTTFYSITQDKKGWKNVQSKIGENRRSSLEEQHEDIKDAIKVRTEGIEKAIVDKTSNIYTKVDKINDITVRNEVLYQNLDVEQKEIRNNVNKLILDWEKTISENKELKSQIDYLKYEKHELMVNRDKAKEKLDKLEKTINENTILKDDNTILKSEIESLKDQNSCLIYQNKELQITNKNLSKNLDIAKQALGIRNIPYDQVEDLDKEKEDDWDLEL